MGFLVISFSNILSYIHTFKGLKGNLCNRIESYGSMLLRTPLPPIVKDLCGFVAKST